MSHEHKGNPVATYIITALILGVITYFEFAIVEYEISWLSRGATIFWLVALSIIKFIMVVAIFMHLKDDEKTYTGFFSSGMLMALATFIILPLLFTVSTFPRPVQAESHEVHAEPEDELAGELQELIESDGYSRSAAALLDTPRPKDRSLVVEPPATAEPQATLAQASEAEGADGADEQATGADQAEAEAAQEPAGGQAAADFDQELGEQVYSTNCASCHQAEGTGVPGAFPPLAGNLINLANAEGGQEYLIDVLLYGLTGQIEVNGQSYNGFMPAWGETLSNDQIAAVLNHEITAWESADALGGFVPITAEQVEAQRGQDPGDLAARRAELETEGQAAAQPGQEAAQVEQPVESEAAEQPAAEPGAEAEAAEAEPEAEAAAAEAEPETEAAEAGAAAETEGTETEAAEAEPEAETEAAAAQPVEFDRALGENSYASSCAGCHGAEGAGIPGAFPPLAESLPQVYNAGGREYLIDVVLHGLTGPITVNGQTYNGVMPAWAGSLSDEQVAAVLNHELTAWGNDARLEEFTPIAPDEVAENRSEEPGDLNARRAELMGQ